MPLIILSILLSALIIITPNFQMLLTYLHELGHDIHLKILNFFTSSDFKYFIKPEEYKYL